MNATGFDKKSYLTYLKGAYCEQEGECDANGY
jgi:hypothetical protein